MTDVVSGPEANQEQLTEAQGPSAGFSDPLVDPLSESSDAAVQMDDGSYASEKGGPVAA